jgi:hypothetical protein
VGLSGILLGMPRARAVTHGVILSPEEEAELEQIIAENDEDERAGRTITVEQFCAERGIPWRTSAG